MIKLLAIAVVMVFSVTGCVSQEYKDTKADADNVHQQITDHTTITKRNKVEHITRPPLIVKSVNATPRITYLESDVSIKVSQLPLSLAISQVMAGVSANIWFDEDVDPNQPVTLHYRGKRGDVLNMLARQTGYGITPKADKVEIRKYISDTFTINLPTGKYDGQLGSQGTQTGEDDNTRIEGQYLNITYDDVSVFDEIANGIKAILTNSKGKTLGDVKQMQSLSLVTVRTTPARMKQVRSFVDVYNEALSQQVLLDIQVLSFASNLGKEQGINWNLVKDVGSGSLQFFVPSTNTISQGAGYGLAFQGSGKWDGTTALIKALEQQGSVSTTTPITALVLNHQPSKLSEAHVIPFLSDVKVQSDDNGTSTEVTRDKVSEGVDMMVTPNIQKDFVWLRIAGKLIKIVKDYTDTVNEVTLRFLDTQESEFTFTNKLRYGQTYVIASVKQGVNSIDKTSSFGMDWLGGSGNKTSTTETLVLLTPRRSL